jgi:diguanylate cyclase (GGDEF)-like protein
MVDVDCFKLFNDRYGHQAGDDCLRQIAMAIKSCLKRPADLVARYGGEEFSCILPDTAFDDAMALATDLERKIRALEVPHQDSVVDTMITISVGLATRTVDSQGDAALLLGLADNQLYLAKQTGRGRVCGKVL